MSGAVLTACVAWWAAEGDLTRRVDLFLLVHGIAFAAYLLALHAAPRVEPRSLRLAVAAALAWRVALVAAPPLLSDDVYRYVWEGRVQLHGGNPYEWEHRPEHPRWTPLRDEVYDRVTHRFYTAVYPPLWQLAAAAVVWAHDSVTAMKAFAVAAELGALAVMARLLRRRAMAPGRLLVWAWSPLALVEIAGGGHNDALALLFAAGALLALEDGRPALAAVLSTGGAQVKAVPALLAAAWVRRFRPWHALLAGAVAAALVWPYASAGGGLWHSLVRFGRFWRFNESVFAVARAGLGSDEGAMLACGVLLLAATGWAAWRVADPARAGLVAVAAMLLLGANVLPWYALWLLPFLVLVESPGALLFTGTVVLAYLVYPDWRSGEPWQVRPAVRALEYLPCLAVAGWQAMHNARPESRNARSAA